MHSVRNYRVYYYSLARALEYLWYGITFKIEEQHEGMINGFLLQKL